MGIFLMTKSDYNLQYRIRKFINFLMYDGKREKAEKTFLRILKCIVIKENKDSMLIFLRALENVRPFVQLQSVRRGSAVYQVPVPLPENRSFSLAMKWIIGVARKKKGGSFCDNIALCMLEASKNMGGCVKLRENLHGIALKNRSFTHFRR